MTRKANPTSQNYNAFTTAYKYLNRRLFEGQLPFALITLQRRSNTLGYFAGERFGTVDGQTVTDEIALNPSHFKGRSVEDILSTLVHEMVHLWQHHYGKPSRYRYHNRQWGRKMRNVGLIPSSTGKEGGHETGQRISHYIDVKGPFTAACSDLLTTGFALPYVELWDWKATKQRRAKEKTKFTCPSCAANAWGKASLNIICADCKKAMNVEKKF